jgi:MtaA/CmuA family methyltransferase
MSGMTGYQRVRNLLAGGEVDRWPLMPITMMFAADQAGVRYGQYVSDYRVLVEAQLRTAEKFDIDHVSCISDPAREAADCGAVVHYFDDQPPAIDEQHSLLKEKTALNTLKLPDPYKGERMADRVRAVALFRQRVGGEKLIEGWIEGPCAAAANLRGINRLMLDFYDDPPFVRALMEFVLEMELRFAWAQVEAGAELIGIGDAAASLIGPRFYAEFVWPWEQKMAQTLHDWGVAVRLHICGNTQPLLPAIGRLGCEIVDIDSMVPLAEARAAMGTQQVLAGNLDPVRVLRNGTPAAVDAALAECARQARTRYIVAAGCEVPRHTPEANLFAMRDFARKF